MEAAVRRLRLHRVGKHTHLRAEHFKQWQWKAYPGGQSKTPLRRERWVCLVDLVHRMWCTGVIPQDLGWTILILIPKVTTNTRGIFLLETLWKVV